MTSFCLLFRQGLCLSSAETCQPKQNPCRNKRKTQTYEAIYISIRMFALIILGRHDTQPPTHPICEMLDVWERLKEREKKSLQVQRMSNLAAISFQDFAAWMEPLLQPFYKTIGQHAHLSPGALRFNPLLLLKSQEAAIKWHYVAAAL